MNLKYVENISTEKKEATMRLYGRIGDSINGTDFATEMRFLAETCNNVTIRINSEGGSVLDGYTVLDAMNEINATGTCNVNTHNSGMAASMASVILCNGLNRTADNYAVTMIHNAKGISEDKVINAINASINTIYTTRTKLNGDTASDLMNAETFMNTDKAMEYGFIDSVIETGRKIKLPKKQTVSVLAAIYNELTTPKQMNKLTALLGLKNEASEEVIVEGVEALKEEVKTLKEDAVKNAEALKVATDKLAAIEAAEITKTETEVIAAVDNAITKGWAKKEVRDSLIELGKVNLATLNTLFDSSSKASKAVNISSVKSVVASASDDRAEWTIRDWERKDAKGLTALKNETPEIYMAMYENFYKLGIGNKNFKQK